MEILDEKFYDIIKSFVFVLVLALVCLGIFHKIKILLAARNGKHYSPRLKILENLIIDSKRRLIRIQNAEQEHLLLLAPAGDILISSSAVKKDSFLEGEKK